MWSYYGSKRSVAHLYPEPRYDTIIEPFAGAAAYSLHEDRYWNRNVVLIDRDQIICAIWEYLIRAKRSWLLDLPEVVPGLTVDDFPELSQEERWLLGFVVSQGCTTPRKTTTVWGQGSHPGQVRIIADNLYKIRNWRIICGDYTVAPDTPATWFVDPPYQDGGDQYKYHNGLIDYTHLANWCRELDGQVMVCENSGARWLPFEPFVRYRGQRHTRTELVWYNWRPPLERPKGDNNGNATQTSHRF